MQFLGFLGGPLGYVMEFIYKFLVSDYGLSLVLFTVLLRVLMFPLRVKQQKSTARMAAYQRLPHIHLINHIPHIRQGQRGKLSCLFVCQCDLLMVLSRRWAAFGKRPRQWPRPRPAGPLRCAKCLPPGCWKETRTPR